MDILPAAQEGKQVGTALTCNLPTGQEGKQEGAVLMSKLPVAQKGKQVGAELTCDLPGAQEGKQVRVPLMSKLPAAQERKLRASLLCSSPNDSGMNRSGMDVDAGGFYSLLFLENGPSFVRCKGRSAVKDEFLARTNDHGDAGLMYRHPQVMSRWDCDQKDLGWEVCGDVIVDGEADEQRADGQSASGSGTSKSGRKAGARVRAVIELI